MSYGNEWSGIIDEYQTVTAEDANYVREWFRLNHPDALAPLEGNEGHPLTLENCDSLASFVFWLYHTLTLLQEESTGKPSTWEAIHDEEYESWPAVVRQFYDNVWAELGTSAASKA